MLAAADISKLSRKWFSFLFNPFIPNASFLNPLKKYQKTSELRERGHWKQMGWEEKVGIIRITFTSHFYNDNKTVFGKKYINPQ